MALGMGGSAREFVLKIVADTTDAQKGIASVDKSAGTFKDKALGIGKAVGGALAVGAVAEFGKATIDAASDAEQSAGAMEAVFKEASGNMAKYGEETAKNLGISNAEFDQMSALMGSLLKNSGTPMDELAGRTQALTERAADLAAMYGGTAADAMNAMTSALKGEMNPLENFGVSLKASTVEAYALAQGWVDAEGKVTDLGKTMATQALIMEQSADAAGTFADESGTLAGQTQIMQAQFKDLQAEIGKKLLPVVVKFATVLQKLISFVVENQDWLVPLVAAIGTVVVAVKAWALAQTILNAALAANPIGLIVIAVAALVAGFIAAYKSSETFRDIVHAAVDVVVGAVKFLWEWIKLVAEVWWTVAQTVWDVAQTIWGYAKDIFEFLIWPYKTAFEIVKGVFEGIVGFVRWIWDTLNQYGGKIKDVLVWPFKTGWDLIKAYFDFIGKAIGAIWDTFKWIGQSIHDAFVWPFKTAWNNVIKPLFDGIDDTVTTVFDSVKKVWDKFYDMLKWPFTAAFDAIKLAWNNTVGGFGFSIPSWVPGVGGKKFTIPEMAAGGIVRGPTIALIGEAGPEAVIPLDKLQQGGGDTYLTINVSTLTGGPEAGRSVYNALLEFQRSSGRRVLAGP